MLWYLTALPRIRGNKNPPFPSAVHHVAIKWAKTLHGGCSPIYIKLCRAQQFLSALNSERPTIRNNCTSRRRSHRELNNMHSRSTTARIPFSRGSFSQCSRSTRCAEKERDKKKAHVRGHTSLIVAAASLALEMHGVSGARRLEIIPWKYGSEATDHNQRIRVHCTLICAAIGHAEISWNAFHVFKLHFFLRNDKLDKLIQWEREIL